MQLLASSGIHFWSWKTEVFLASVKENSIKIWLFCIQRYLDIETGFWKSLFVLVCKCGISRAGKYHKGNPVDLIFRLLMSEAHKKEVVAVTMALQCLGQKGWYRWAAASLTEVIKSPFLPNQTSFLSQSFEGQNTCQRVSCCYNLCIDIITNLFCTQGP